MAGRRMYHAEQPAQTNDSDPCNGTHSFVTTRSGQHGSGSTFQSCKFEPGSHQAHESPYRTSSTRDTSA